MSASTFEEEETLEMCKLCARYPMRRIVRYDGAVSSFHACENCDSPKGRLPTPRDPT